MATGQNIESLVIPGNAQTIPESIYNKGVILNVPGHKVPMGGCIEAKNYMSSERGLKRRPGIGEWNDDAISYPPWQDLPTYWKNTGVQEFLGIDQKFLYVVEADSYTPLQWTYTKAVNVTVSGATVTAAADAEWDDAANEIQAGDVILYGASYEYSGTIASVDSSTQLTLTASGTAYGPAGSWKIARAFKATKPYLVDWAVVPGPTPMIVFADFSRFLYGYNGTTFTDYSAVEDIVPRCVAYFKNRVWVGGYIDSSGYDRRQGIAWTELADLDDFTNGGYVDLPYVKGALKRLVPMGDFLIGFFDDALYIGRQTNLAAMPLSFQKLETGGIGLLGQKAVIPFIDSLFFVGQDDIYAVSSRGMEAIGSAVVRRTIKETASAQAWKIFACPDLRNDRILFGFPKNSEEIEEVWSFNFKTKAWGWDGVNCYMMASNVPSGQKTWEDWVTQDWDTGTVATTISDQTLTASGSWGTFPAAGDTVLIDLDGDGNYEFETTVQSYTDTTHLEMVLAATSTNATAAYRIVHSTATWEAGGDLDAYPSWESVGASSSMPNVYVMKFDILDVYGEDAATDKGTALTTELVTGDRDFDLPDDEKTFYRLAVKLDDFTDVPLTFACSVSNDRGQNWKSIGNLVIQTNDDEGKVNFRMRGSMCRFKLVGVNNSTPYTINEITMDVRKVGLEVAGREDQ